MQQARLALPIISEEQNIVELVYENDVIIICGETGSGKTTQVPQFLYEAGYASGDGKIGVTEPRRVAAMSMARRVGEELNLKDQVSYQIRYESDVSPQTKIKFMTDGVLLRELSQRDFLLKDYSCIIIDEAHERSTYTDILIGLLSRIVKVRRKKEIPLKLIIMSATLRVEDFTQNQRLFPVSPPLVHIKTRQHPVYVHFNKKTPSGEGEYLSEAYKKVCRIHRKLPLGTILVFVTSQQEVHSLSRWLRSTFSETASVKQKAMDEGNDDNHSDLDEDDKNEGLNSPRFKLDNYTIKPIDEDDERFVTKRSDKSEMVKSEWNEGFNFAADSDLESDEEELAQFAGEENGEDGNYSQS